MSIFGIGTVVVDHVVEVPRYPKADTKVELTHDWRQVGGPVPVALSTAAFYGSKTVFLGRWGNDESGQLIQQTLTDREMDVSTCRSSDEWQTGFAHVWVDTSSGARTITYSRGQFPVPGEDDVTEQDLKDCSILHLDGWAELAAKKAASIVRANGGTVVLDAGSAKPGMNDLLQSVDILIASRLFRQSQFGTADVSAELLLNAGPSIVITTDGSGGATWHSKETVVHQPAERVSTIDTNGAGDVLAGALLHAIEARLPATVALSFACKVATYSCTQRGNHSLPPAVDVLSK